MILSTCNEMKTKTKKKLKPKKRWITRQQKSTTFSGIFNDDDDDTKIKLRKAIICLAYIRRFIA